MEKEVFIRITKQGNTIKAAKIHPDNPRTQAILEAHKKQLIELRVFEAYNASQMLEPLTV